ncbi:MAG: hypothetical protein H0V70_13460 [Ktedonobacteraceae bacterium]|nr:hypothetical protein [Ktedonobacteraceae bacterium]
MRMRAEGEKGYPWLSFDITGSWVASMLLAALVIGISVAFYVVYSRLSPDTAPDSIAGYSYAVAGTGFMLLAALRFSQYRRSRQRTTGKLNAFLNWHVAFGIIALILLFLHSFGNFNPRSGTYALYGMIALAISGFIGRGLDRIMPRLITEEARKALTAQGDDRIENISQRLHSIVSHNSQEVRGFQPDNNGRSMPGIAGLTGTPFANAHAKSTKDSVGNGKGGPVLQTSWDLAYISLDETPQELSRDSAQYRFVPDRKSTLARPGALIPGAQEHITALADVQKALKREELFRYVIRYWRVFHISLAVLTIGLTLWHLEFAATLLLPVFFHI